MIKTMITNEQLQQIRSVSIIDLLSKQGYHPVAKKASGIWFKAPWRDENEPSLKVSPDLNVWFDFGAHVGGDAIALVEFQHNKHFSEACEMIQSLMNGLVFDSTPVQMPSKTSQKKQNVEYAYLKEQEIESPAIIRYLEGRRISKAIADKYCCELHYGKTATENYYSLAFKTGEKSYELRNANFKGCIGPKSIAILHACGTTETEKKVTACVVFEGFFNMLTYVQLLQQGSPVCIIEYPCDMIVLNSAGFAPHAQPIFDEYGKIHCYLDNDKTGHCKTLEILDRNPGRATDESCRYESYNDLNDYLCGRIQFKPEDVLPED